MIFSSCFAQHFCSAADGSVDGIVSVEGSAVGVTSVGTTSVGATSTLQHLQNLTSLENMDDESYLPAYVAEDLPESQRIDAHFRMLPLVSHYSNGTDHVDLAIDQATSVDITDVRRDRPPSYKSVRLP